MVRAERLIVVIICFAFVLLALAASTVPIFEAPDEIEHYRYIRAVAESGWLPDPGVQPRSQYHQAPLYYLLLAPIASFLPDDDFAQIEARTNPFYGVLIGLPGNDNKNLYLHRRAETFPMLGSPTARAVHILRLGSVLMGIGTLTAAYALFRRLWAHTAAERLLALGIIGFMPAFVAGAGTLNNDNLLILLSTLTLYILVEGTQTGWTAQRAAALGVILGAALLTKISAGFLAIPVLTALLLERRLWRYIPVIAILIALICGWWYARNWALFADPTLMSVMTANWRAEGYGSFRLDLGLERIPFAYSTFWARFNGGVVPAPAPILIFYDALTLAALVGCALGAVRVLTKRPRLKDRQMAFVIVYFTLAWLLALLYLASTVWSGNQGRYLHPALAAWGALLAFGLTNWLPRRWGALSFALLPPLAVAAAISIFGALLPAYYPAPMREPARLIGLRYGDVVELIGMSPANPSGFAGKVIPISLHWRALRPTEADVRLYLHSVETELVRRDSYPAAGNLLAADWHTGETWTDTYHVRIPDNAPPQNSDLLTVGLVDHSGAALPAYDADGRMVTPIIGRIAVHGQPTQPTAWFRFGDNLALALVTTMRGDDMAQICFDWFATASVNVDYHIFVHLYANGAIVGAWDGQPKGGRYPTSVWLPNEVIHDCVRVNGKGSLFAFGIYNLATMQRLPALETPNQPLLDDQVWFSVD